MKRTHGLSATRPYHAWMHMKQRCYNPRAPHFENYGGRGIRVCESWHKFENFWNDMKGTFRTDLELDRIDNSGNYEPNNCRWATRAQQNQNTRASRIMNTPVGLMCVSRAARQFNQVSSTVYGRLNRGWSDWAALGLK